MTQENVDLQRHEDLLRKALLHENPSVGFAQRVIARASQSVATNESSRNHSWHSIFFRPVVRWGAISAVGMSLIVGAVRYREVRRERAQGEAAKQQLMLALHIAGSKLHLAKVKVNEINSNPPQKKHEPNRSRSKS